MDPGRHYKVTRRCLDLIEALGLCRRASCGYVCVLEGLLRSYREVTEELDAGRMKFDKCRALLMAIEDEFDSVKVQRYIYNNLGKFSKVDVDFMYKCGFVPMDQWSV